MSRGVIRLVVPDSNKENHVAAALGIAVDLHAKLGCFEDLTIVIPTKKDARGHRLAAALGDQAITNMLKKRSVTFNNRCNLKLESTQTLKGVGKAEVIVAAFAYPEMLSVIDGLPGVRAVVVAPSVNANVDEWIRTWNPQVVGQESKEPERLIDDPILEEALRSIMDHINLSMGLTSPGDREYVVSLLKCLSKHQHLTDSPESVSDWAVREGWLPEPANELAGIVRDLQAGRRRKGRKHFPCTKAIQQLRDRTDQS